MSYSLHSGAEQDIADAIDFYIKKAGLGVAERFLAELDRVLNLLVEHPSLGAPITSGRRTFPLKVFPYSVVYLNLTNSIQILIVRHQHRKPSYALNRK